MPNSCNLIFILILILYENTHEIYEKSVQASLDDWDVAKKYQVHLSHKTWQNLTDIDTFENIRLIQAYIYHDYYKSFCKGQGIMAIHHNLPFVFIDIVFKYRVHIVLFNKEWRYWLIHHTKNTMIYILKFMARSLLTVVRSSVRKSRSFYYQSSP